MEVPMTAPHTYITTTIPYVNARPHIGFALELVQADVLAGTTGQPAPASGSRREPTTTR
jgi:hypothetical protein